jgi:hypothetical protein
MEAEPPSDDVRGIPGHCPALRPADTAVRGAVIIDDELRAFRDDIDARPIAPGLPPGSAGKLPTVRHCPD